MFRGQHTLQTYIASVFIIIVSIMSILLIILGYQNSKELNETIAQERMMQSAEQIKLTFQKMTASVFTSLNTLYASNFAEQLQVNKEQSWLNIINIIMKTNPDILSIYLGFDNKRSVFFRTMRPSLMKSRFDAPKNAVLMVDINQTNKIQRRLFYDKNLHLIVSKTEHIDYDPTLRPWFKDAPLDGRIHMTKPYLYRFIKQNGVTFSKRLAKDKAVVAIDISVHSLNLLLQSLTLSNKAQIIVFDDKKSIIATRGLSIKSPQKTKQQKYLDAIESSPFKVLFHQNIWHEKSEQITYNSIKWRLNLVKIISGNENDLWLAKAIPEKDLISDAITSRNKQIILTLIMLILASVMVFAASQYIATLLKKLNKASFKIQNLNFENIDLPESNILEINELSHSFKIMSQTIRQFLDTLQQVSKNSNFTALLSDMVAQCKNISDADFVLMWSFNKNEHAAMNNCTYCPEHMSTTQISYEKLINDISTLYQTLKQGQTFTFSPDKWPHLDYFPKDLKRAWVFPLTDRENELVGCIFIGFNHQLQNIQEDKIHFVQTFLGFISLIKENWEHICAQKALFSSFVEMIASAIDTKSPYTGAHCQRVPVLTFMLAEAVSENVDHFPYFHLNDLSKEALYIAAWLHDCGKVTTPEYVVDKATKLETIYNRIHEIRTRFEVLKRDNEIYYWQKRASGGSEQKWATWLIQEQQKLDDDFAFIAKCNQGDERVTDEDLARLEQIAQRTWLRTLDDSLGLSWEEKQRRQHNKTTSLPCIEMLLIDKIDQKIPWSQKQQHTFDHWQFKTKIPKLQYNRGELYNLSIRSGTLSDEERFIINNHVIQTIVMLNKLPYPNHLARIPEMAGGHHERLDGLGYPNQLSENELCLETKIMAIADIFEALTANDRPYKKAKTLSQSLNIMLSMVKNRHIDGQLFSLFIEQKIYLQYANKYLPNEQIDDVNQAMLLDNIKLYLQDS